MTGYERAVPDLRTGRRRMRSTECTEPGGPATHSGLALDANGRPAVRSDSLVRALADLGVARRSLADDGVMTAAVVLFAKEPTRFIPGASVQLVRRLGVGPGPGASESREECSGTLPEVLDCCLEFIGRHTARYQAVVGTRREDMAEYPESVLREVVLNLNPPVWQGWIDTGKCL